MPITAVGVIGQRSSYEKFLLNLNFDLRIRFSAENPLLSQAAKRRLKAYDNYTKDILF